MSVPRVLTGMANGVLLITARVVKYGMVQAANVSRDTIIMEICVYYV